MSFFSSSSTSSEKQSSITSEFIPDEQPQSQSVLQDDFISDNQVETPTAVFESIPKNPTIQSVLGSLPLEDRPQLRMVASGVPGTKPVELVFIDENPLFKPATRPAGTFGPLPMRTGYDKVFYGTGASYLLGLSYGGVYGVIRGLQTAQVPNFRVRMNAIINQTTRYGPWAANSLGVMTMTWAILDNLAGLIRGKSDYANHISAAFATGMLFKSTAGLRPAVLTGSVLASVVSTYGVYDWYTSPANTPAKGKKKSRKNNAPASSSLSTAAA